MGDERAGVDDHHAQEKIVMLRHDDKEGGRQQVHRDEKLIEHADAYLVVVARAQIVDDARKTDDEDIDKGQGVFQGQMTVVRRQRHFGQTGEMGHGQGEILLIDEPHGGKPVRGEQSEHGGKEVAPARSLKAENGEQPQGRNEIEGFRICHGTKADEEVGIEGAPHGCAVLIGPEKKEIGRENTHRCHRLADGGEHESDGRRQDDERAGDHPAVDPDEGVAVVELHHEVGGGHETGELNPPLFTGKTCRTPYGGPIDGYHGKREAAFGYSVLYSLHSMMNMNEGVAEATVGTSPCLCPQTNVD